MRGYLGSIWWSIFGCKKEPVNVEEVIRTTLRHYRVEDPCEAAWFSMALRKLLPEWGIV
jgi:hypothetical protein